MPIQKKPALDSGENKSPTNKTEAKMTQCFFINPDLMKTAFPEKQELELDGFGKHLQCRTLHLSSQTYETYKDV